MALFEVVYATTVASADAIAAESRPTTATVIQYLL